MRTAREDKVTGVVGGPTIAGEIQEACVHTQSYHRNNKPVFTFTILVYSVLMIRKQAALGARDI